MAVERSESLPQLSIPEERSSLHQPPFSLDLPTLNSASTINKDCDHDTDRTPGTTSQISAQMHTSLSHSIIEAVHQFIREERLRSFRFLAQHSHRHMDQEKLLVLSQATKDDIQTIRRRDREFRLMSYADNEWFTFDEPMVYDSLRRTVAISVPQGQVPGIENITITTPSYKSGSRFSPAATWLRQTYDCDDDWVINFSETQYEEQQLWWNSNGKVFRILDLPLELREATYLNVVGSVIVPELYRSRVVFGNGLLYENARRVGRNRDPDIEPPNMAIMRVSKQVHREATLVAHRDTFKRLRAAGVSEHSSPATKPLQSMATLIGAIKSSAPHVAFLRNLQLEMSAASSFASIGVYAAFDRPFRIATGPFTLCILKNFPALRHLDFRFISPKHPDAICPWALITQANELGEHSCQKIWIDWFFTFAWAVLKALHNVNITLSGCVKISRKIYWEHVLNDKRVDHTPAINNARKRIWQQKKDAEPIPCACSSPCSKAGMEAGKVYTWDENDVRRIEGLQEHIDAIYWDFED
jgi:hypothetical protein